MTTKDDYFNMLLSTDSLDEQWGWVEGKLSEARMDSREVTQKEMEYDIDKSYNKAIDDAISKCRSEIEEIKSKPKEKGSEIMIMKEITFTEGMKTGASNIIFELKKLKGE